MIWLNTTQLQNGTVSCLYQTGQWKQDGKRSTNSGSSTCNSGNNSFTDHVWHNIYYQRRSESQSSILPFALVSLLVWRLFSNLDSFRLCIHDNHNLYICCRQFYHLVLYWMVFRRGIECLQVMQRCVSQTVSGELLLLKSVVHLWSAVMMNLKLVNSWKWCWNHPLQRHQKKYWRNIADPYIHNTTTFMICFKAKRVTFSYQVSSHMAVSTLLFRLRTLCGCWCPEHPAC